MSSPAGGVFLVAIAQMAIGANNTFGDEFTRGNAGIA